MFAPRISPETPLRRAITLATRLPETDCVAPLLEAATLPEAQRAAIAATAAQLIERLRAKDRPGGESTSTSTVTGEVVGS